MIRPTFFSVVSLLFLTSACSTVIEGRTQTIAVDTYPTGAECVVKDNDLILARVLTPGQAVIEKSKNDILVECNKEGYIGNKQRNRSDVAISSVANMAFGQWSFVGNMVDSATGASHKYDSKVFLALNPLPPVALPPVAGNAVVVAREEEGQDEPSASPEATDLGRSIAQALGARNAVVTQKPLDEVLRTLMQQQPAEPSPVADGQQVASLLPNPIYHNAE